MPKQFPDPKKTLLKWMNATHLAASVTLEGEPQLLLDLREPAGAELGGLLLRAVEELEDGDQAEIKFELRPVLAA